MDNSLRVKSQYTFKPPFDSLQTDRFYNVDTESTIEALVKDGVDVFNLVYKPNGVTLDVFMADFTEGVSIVSLTDGATIIPVPSKYLLSRQDISKHRYTPIGITVNLGNLTSIERTVIPAIESDIVNLIKHYIGVTPVVSDVELGSIVLKTEAEHITVNTARAVIKQTTPSLQVENARLQVEIAKLNAIIEEQTKVIVNKIPLG